MGADLSRLSDADLVALKSGDLTKVSDAGLMALKSSAPATPAATAKPNPINSDVQDALSGYASGPLGIGPTSAINLVTNMARMGMGAANSAIEKGAYNAGGTVTDVAARAGLSPEDAAKVGYGTNVAIQAVPNVVGSLLGGNAASPAVQQGAKELMQSALKPALGDLKKGNAAEAIQTMLDEGISVTRGGVQKLRAKIDDLNRQIALAIRNSTATIDKQAVWGPVKEKLDYFTRQVNPQNDIATIKAAWDNFLNHPLATGDTMPVQLAQEIKQGTTRILSGKYGEIGSAETEASKAMTRGLKDQIAQAVPGIGALNAQDSRLLNAMPIVERRVLMAANRDISGIGLLAKNPEAWAAFMADRSPAFKSLMARLLYANSRAVPQAAIGTGIAAAQSVNQTAQ